MANLLRPLWRYADFQGRSGRSEFWLFFSLSALVFMFTVFGSLFDAQIGNVSDPAADPPNAVLIYLLWWLATAVPWFALQVRRFHDIGLSGWLALINGSAYLALLIAPPVGLVLFALSLLLMAIPGKSVARPSETVTEDAPDRERHRLTSPQSHVAQSTSGTPSAGTELLADPDVEARSDGRFVAGGFSFTTEQQARDFAERQRRPLSPLPAHTHRTDRTFAERPNSERPVTEQAGDTSDPDVRRTENGRYASGGLSYSSFEQARAAAERKRKRKPTFPAGAPPRPSTATTASPAILRSAAEDVPAETAIVTEPENPASTTTPHSLPFPHWPEVHETGDGRFACGGYIFTTFDQARHYAERRRGVASNSIRPPDPRLVQQSERTIPAAQRGSEQVATGFHSALSSLFSSKTAAETGRPRASTGRNIAAERWIAAATRVTVGDIDFEAELLYFGSPARKEGRHRALVDPALPLGAWSDRSGSSLGYWPHYSELQPGARRAYIEWLADGRRNPATPIGYVFLYFYGLERRLVKAKAADESGAIMGELDALLSVYGDNYSFAGYARSLMDAAQVLHGSPPDSLTASIESRYAWEIPIPVRLYLGEKVAKGEPIGAEDALCWALAHPQIWPRTAAKRCFDDFKALWHHEYETRFPGGIKVAKPKTRLSYQYRSASSEFNAIASLDHLPDIASISAPVAKFEQLLNDCTDALDPLSRFLGRHPAEQGSVLAAALAPPLIRSRDPSGRYALVRSQLEERIAGTGFAPVKLAELLDLFLDNGAIEAKDQRQNYRKRLGDILDAMKVGFEPDKRFGPAPTLSEDMTLCLFDATSGAPAAGSGRYDVARTMVEIAVLAAQADNLVVEAELESIVRDLGALNELTPPERTRLEAHMHALVHNPPKLRAATKRVADLTPADKEMVLQSVINAVLADQRVTPTEVRFLEGLYKLLGKPQDEVYSRLHSGPDAPSPAPTPNKAAARVSRDIDSDKLARIREETAAVSTMLASIFREEDPENEPEPAAPLQAEEQALFAGLDAPHSHLLMALIESPIEADVFASLCKREKLLPGGAIETINDWAFDILDEVAIEDEDIYCLQPHILTTLKGMIQKP
ncbi:MAG: TerB N-terminal domain-containing protein [Sphingopyxis sp.]|nr:TerB N-terminal domain-containing protein [Sphingopyxis sp.]